MGTIQDYLPKREPTTNLQVKMPKELVDRVKRQLKDDNVNSWCDFLTACFMSYLASKEVGTKSSINNQLKQIK